MSGEDETDEPTQGRALYTEGLKPGVFRALGVKQRMVKWNLGFRKVFQDVVRYSTAAKTNKEQ